MTARHGDAPCGRTPWRRRLRDLLHRGRAVAAAPRPGPLGPVRPDLGPHARALRADTTRIDLAARPRQGRLGDCWVMAALLAVHDRAPALLEDALELRPDGTALVRLAGAQVHVDRRMPVDGAGRWVYATQSGAGPGWPGLMEKALAAHLAGSYRLVARGFGRFGLQALVRTRVRTLLLLPSAARLERMLAQRRAVLASTHPLSPLVRGPHGRLPPNHVMVVVGADAATGHVRLRNPWRPDDVLVLDRRSFRRGFLSLDVTEPLGLSDRRPPARRRR